jgi:hypothetical protein
MLESLIETIAKAYEAARHRDLLSALWRQERWFTSSRQKAAAEIACGALGADGLEDARLVPFAADGRTRFQDWTTHLAWDCDGAGLRLGDEVLIDYSTPASVVQWSGPLEETTAPVVDGDAPGPVGPEAVRGKFVLTGRPPREMKQVVKSAGPAGVLSDFLGTGAGYDEDTVRWCNTWADGPDGWYFRAADSRLPGFCLSPRQGAALRRRLAQEPGLKVTAHCRSRFYEGHSHCVTAALAGRDASREVWLFGHACEQGANDNASGVSVGIEALRMLAGLIEAGVLPRPRRSIRLVTTEECIGMLAFIGGRGDLRRRAIAGLNLDSIGDRGGPDRPFTLFFGPLSAPTFGWAAAGAVGEALARRSRGSYFIRSLCVPPTGDDMIADPACGIPCLWLGHGKGLVGYHSSSDTPAVCEEESLRSNTLLAAAWAYATADLADASARAILPAATRWIEANVLPAPEADAAALRRWAAGRMLRDLARWGASPAVYEDQAARYAPAGAAPLADLPAGGPRLVRRTWGTATLETLPKERTLGLGRWSTWQAAALYWADGLRPPEAIERLVRAEVGRVPDGAVAHLAEACVEAGVAEWA